MADRVNAVRHVDKPARPVRGAAASASAGIIGRIGRVLREGVQDVGEQQFLVLLLVMQADLEISKTRARIRRRHLAISRSTRGIDMGAIARRPRRRSAA